MSCPICHSEQFYIQDEGDFEIIEFTSHQGRIQFEDPDTAEKAPTIANDRRIFCQRCSWRGRFDQIR